MLLLVVDAVTLMGKLGMTVFISISSQLHTPIYFALAKLASVGVAYSTFITLKMLCGHLVRDRPCPKELKI